MINLLAETTNLIPEYIAMMNSKDKCLYFHVRAYTIVGALFDFIGLFEIQTGCRHGKANWQAIFEVGAYI